MTEYPEYGTTMLREVYENTNASAEQRMQEMKMKKQGLTTNELSEEQKKLNESLTATLNDQVYEVSQPHTEAKTNDVPSLDITNK